ncbi:hypothetical protein C8Q80DRAFT_1207843, partial [Daedaleopsis nitida]
MSECCSLLRLVALLPSRCQGSLFRVILISQCEQNLRFAGMSVGTAEIEDLHGGLLRTSHQTPRSTARNSQHGL